MKTLSSYLKRSLGKVKQAFFRFPLVLLWALAGTLYAIWLIEVAESLDNKEVFKYLKILMVFLLGVSWLIAAKLFSTYLRDRNKKFYWIPQLSVLVLLLLYYLLLPGTKEAFENPVVGYRFATYFVVGHLAVFVAPFLSVQDKSAFWNYVTDVIKAWVIGVIFSLIFYLGMVLALLSLEFLFQVHLDGSLYFKVFAFSAGMLLTLLFVSYLPEAPWNTQVKPYPSLLEMFSKYLLIPLLILYAVILTAYAVKILVQWDLPRGGVSWLILVFGFLGFAVYFIVYPVSPSSKSTLIRRFYPVFFAVFILLSVLLFVAIGRRIADYGFTENRYYVLLTGLWMLGMSLYVLISRRKSLKVFVLSFIALAMLSAIGPWSAFAFTKRSQLHRLERLIRLAEQNNFQLYGQEKRELRSVVKLLSERKYTDEITRRTGFEPEGENREPLAGLIEEVYQNFYHNPEGPPLMLYFHPGDLDTRPLVIAGYDLLFDVYLVNNTLREQGDYAFRLKDNLLIIQKNDSVTARVDLQHFIVDLKAKKESGTNDTDFSSEDLSLENQYGEIATKLIFKELVVRQDADDEKNLKIENMHILVLLKNKQAGENRQDMK